LFYDNSLFYDWVADCRINGINCLIIPGIMPILGYDRFLRMLKFTKTKVPKEIFDTLETIKADDEKVMEYGVEFGVKQTKDLMKNGFKFIHYYTMNLETSVL
jgi:methylenetetrahydrofolate reductase (NADPH)